MPTEDRLGVCGDGEQKVLAHLLPFKPKDLGERLERQFRALSREKAARVEDEFPNPRRFDRFKGTEIDDTFRLAALILDQDKYLYRVVEARQCSEIAYDILVQTIAHLGPLYRGKDEQLAASSPGSPRDISRMKEAINRLCEFLSPDCATAYFYNRRLNRAEWLHEVGLQVPEFCHGTVWYQDLPTTVLFDESQVQTKLYPPFPLPSCLPDTIGSFRDRENVNQKRVVAIRLTWNQSRVVIFLNWRSNNGTPKSSIVRAIWDDIDAAYSTSPPRVSMQVLQLAVRYFVGWLGASGIDLSEKKTPPSDTVVHEVVDFVRRAAFGRDDGTRRAALEAAATFVLRENEKAPQVHCNVHWVIDNSLKYKPDKYDGAKFESEPEYGLPGTGEPRPVPATVCHAACLYGIPLLINDFNRRPSLLAGKSWREIDLPRTGLRCESEIAVPVGEGRDIRAVVNVECGDAASLSPLHVRRIELVTHMYYAVQRVLASSKENGECRDFVEKLLDPGKRYLHAQHLCKRFCDWVRASLDSDLAYLLIYDPRTRVFRPLGTSVSEANVSCFLSEEGEARNLGFDLPDERPAWKSILKKPAQAATDNNPRQPILTAIHALVEHAISSRITPSRRAHTWDIFRSTGRTGQFIPDIRKGKWKSHFPPSAKPYVQTLLGLRFAHSENATSDGVLWVSWQSKQKAEEAVGLKLTDSEQAWIRTAHSRLGPVSEVAAAIYAVYRHFDANAAADPLPYES